MTEAYSVPLTKIYQKTERTIQLESEHVKSPKDAINILGPLIGQADRENFVVISLNTKYKPVNVEITSVGSLSSSLIHPRETFKGAILSNAAAILVAHNHPSQQIKASDEDIQVTKRLVEAGELLGIDVLDHLIINDKHEYYSMKEFSHI